MLKFSFFTLILAFLSLPAMAMKMNCQVKHNTTLVFQNSLEIGAQEKNKVIGEYNGFTFFLSSLGNSVLELQVYNQEEPSRTYSTAVINQNHSFVDLAIWKREFLMEVRCSL